MYIYIYIYIYIKVRHPGDGGLGCGRMGSTPMGPLRKTTILTDSGKGTPWHVREDKRRLTGVPQKIPLSKNMKSAVTPLVLTPFVPFRQSWETGRKAQSFDAIVVNDFSHQVICPFPNAAPFVPFPKAFRELLDGLKLLDLLYPSNQYSINVCNDIYTNI